MEVPREIGPRVSARPLAPVYQTARGADIGAFGSTGEGLARAGQQLQAASGELADIALRRMIEDNEREAKDLDNKYREQLRKIQFGDGTADNPGFYSLQGENAIRAYAPTEAAITKLRNDMLGQIRNERVREMFEFSSIDQENFVLTNMGRHYSQEREVANDAVDEARINEAADEAAAYRGSPEAMARAFSTMNGSILAMGERKGWAPEVVASKQQEARSVIYRKAFDNIVLDSAEAGEKFFLDNKEQIDARLWPEFERDIKVQKKAEQTEREHQEYLGRLRKQEAREAAFDEWSARITQSVLAGEDIDLTGLPNDKRLEGSDRFSIFNFAKAQANEDGVSTAQSQRTTADLFERIALPPEDPRKISTRSEIDQAFIDGNLKRSDHDWLVKALSESATPEGERLNKMQGDFLTGMKSQFTKSNMFVPDPKGDAQFYEFQQYVSQKVIEARANKEDPYELFRPGTPKYLGSAAVISQFQRSLKTITEDQLGRLGTGTPKSTGGARKDYTSSDQVVKDYNEGKLDYDAAAKILRDKGWAE